MIDLLVGLGLLLGGLLGGVGLVGYYVLFHPEKAEKVAGWVFALAARVYRRADKTAIAMKVQGEVNGLGSNLQRDAPEMIDKKLKIKWKDAEEAEAVVRGGDVVVFMRDSRRHEENVATAIMAFLPKAVLTRARRYIEPETMHAVDLTVAKALLTGDNSSEGALDVFSIFISTQRVQAQIASKQK